MKSIDMYAPRITLLVAALCLVQSASSQTVYQPDKNRRILVEGNSYFEFAKSETPNQEEDWQFQRGFNVSGESIPDEKVPKDAAKRVKSSKEENRPGELLISSTNAQLKIEFAKASLVGGKQESFKLPPLIFNIGDKTKTLEAMEAEDLQISKNLKIWVDKFELGDSQISLLQQLLKKQKIANNAAVTAQDLLSLSSAESGDYRLLGKKHKLYLLQRQSEKAGGATTVPQSSPEAPVTTVPKAPNNSTIIIIGVVVTVVVAACVGGFILWTRRRQSATGPESKPGLTESQMNNRNRVSDYGAVSGGTSNRDSDLIAKLLGNEQLFPTVPGTVPQLYEKVLAMAEWQTVASPDHSAFDPQVKPKLDNEDRVVQKLKMALEQVMAANSATASQSDRIEVDTVIVTDLFRDQLKQIVAWMDANDLEKSSLVEQRDKLSKIADFEKTSQEAQAQVVELEKQLNQLKSVENTLESTLEEKKSLEAKIQVLSGELEAQKALAESTRVKMTSVDKDRTDLLHAIEWARLRLENQSQTLSKICELYGISPEIESLHPIFMQAAPTSSEDPENKTDLSRG